MTSVEMAKKFLKNGLLLKIYYTNNKNVKKYVYLLKGDMINLIDPDIKLNKNKIYNICLQKEFSLTKNIPEVIEYISMPKDITMDLLLNSKNNFLKRNTEYIKEIKEKYFWVKSVLEYYYKEQLWEFKNLTNDEIFDLCVLRFYPKKFKKIKNMYQKIKNDIDEKHFICDYQEDNVDPSISTIPAFKLFGISDKNLNVDDVVFVNSLKKRWYFLIEQQKKEIIQKLKDTDVSFLNKNEQKEYNNEILLFENELNLINFNSLSCLKTAKDVIKYWPDTLQPPPYFVYED